MLKEPYLSLVGQCIVLESLRLKIRISYLAYSEGPTNPKMTIKTPNFKQF